MAESKTFMHWNAVHSVVLNFIIGHLYLASVKHANEIQCTRQSLNMQKSCHSEDVITIQTWREIAGVMGKLFVGSWLIFLT